MATIEFCNLVMEAGNDLYIALRRAKTLSKGNKVETIVTCSNTHKKVIFVNGKPKRG